MNNKFEINYLTINFLIVFKPFVELKFTTKIPLGKLEITIFFLVVYIMMNFPRFINLCDSNQKELVLKIIMEYGKLIKI